DSTFAGYITYCAKEGIINGYADGTFRPSATLNGYAFMKMLLGALGYDATVEQFTGANWSVNVAKLAIGIELDDGLTETFNGSKAVTREEACLYALNTLKATMVEYDSKTNVTISGVEVVVGGGEAKKVKQVGTDKLGDEDYQQFGEEYFSNLKLNDTTDDFERPANQWKIKNDEIGIYAKTPDATYTAEVKGKNVYSDLGGKYAINAYYVNGEVANDQLKKSGKTDFKIERNNDDVKIGGNGVLTEAYIIEGKTEDTVTLVSVVTYLAQVSGDYDKDDEELVLSNVDEEGVAEVPVVANELTLNSDDFANLNAYEDEDYVLVTVADGVIKSIAKAEKVTAAVSTYENEDSVTAGGTKYSYSKSYNNAEGKVDGYTIKDEYDLYLDAYGYVMFADGVDAEGKYVYVDDFYGASTSNKSNVKANAYFLDGTNEEIIVDKIGGSSVKKSDLDGKDAPAHGWYSYTTSAGKYKLTSAAGNTEFNSGVVTDKDTVKIANTDFKGTSSTIFVVVDDDDDATVYTGIKKVPEITLNGDGVLSIVPETDSKGKDTNYAKYVFIDLGDKGTSKGGSKTGDVIFLYKEKVNGKAYDKKGTDADENVYYSYKAVLNGEVTKVKFDEDHGTLGYGLFTEVEYDDSKYVSKYTAVTENNYDAKKASTEDWTADEGLGGITASQKNGVVTIGTVDYYLADGAKIMVEDDGDIKTVTAKKLASDYAKAITDVYGVMDSNGEFTYLFIMTNK
ncbi:S-layer homology domain-containing protein, partial [Dysosmobacter sp.]